MGLMQESTLTNGSREPTTEDPNATQIEHNAVDKYAYLQDIGFTTTWTFFDLFQVAALLLRYPKCVYEPTSQVQCVIEATENNVIASLISCVAQVKCVIVSGDDDFL